MVQLTRRMRVTIVVSKRQWKVATLKSCESPTECFILYKYYTAYSRHLIFLLNYLNQRSLCEARKLKYQLVKLTLKKMDIKSKKSSSSVVLKLLSHSVLALISPSHAKWMESSLKSFPSPSPASNESLFFSNPLIRVHSTLLCTHEWYKQDILLIGCGPEAPLVTELCCLFFFHIYPNWLAFYPKHCIKHMLKTGDDKLKALHWVPSCNLPRYRLDLTHNWCLFRAAGNDSKWLLGRYRQMTFGNSGTLHLQTEDSLRDAIKRRRTDTQSPPHPRPPPGFQNAQPLQAAPGSVSWLVISAMSPSFP